MTTRFPMAVALTCLLSSGCAQNAILEITIDMPAADPLRPNLVVQALSGEADFSNDWPQSQLTGIPLDTTEANLVEVGIEGSGDDLLRELNVRLRFCEDPECHAIADGDPPEVWLTFERAFYQAEYTSYEVSLMPPPTMAPSSPTVIGKCAVFGCVEGSSETGYCIGDVHHCE